MFFFFSAEIKLLSKEVISKEMCHVLANKCFEKDTHVTGYNILPELLREYIYISFPCAFEHKNGQTINFSFTALQNSGKEYVILFQKYDRYYDKESENKIIDVFAVIPANEVHNYYNLLFPYSER